MYINFENEPEDTNTIEEVKLFQSLVNNAIDFLNQSMYELKKDKFKYSVINFYNSIELFFKARLMQIKWSLIIVTQESEEADFSKFQKGRYNTVGLDKAIEKIKKAGVEELSQNAKNCFTQLQEKRNKLVHFFHSEYDKPDLSIKDKVVSEQLQGWYYLHQLLTEDWLYYFRDYQDEISSLNRELLKFREFLKAKNRALLPEIEKERQNGYIFRKCPSCNYKTFKQVNYEPLEWFECRICNLIDLRKLIIPCPDCKSNIVVEDFGFGECEKCNRIIDMNWLIDFFSEENGFDINDGFAYCSECEYFDQPSVIPFQEEWLCLNCLNLQQVSQCEWCSELVTGETENSYFSGCVMCEGKFGSEKNE